MVFLTMSRPLRIEYPGAVYHITSRGNALENIYCDDQDRDNFLSVLGSVVKKYNWLCHTYCLMDNHYHLMIETLDANLSLGMRQLNGVYTQRYNRRHGKPGHLFQGRFKAILVDKETYLLELCRYVVLNPVRAGILESPDEWKWSSYLSTTGARQCPDYLTTDWLLGIFGSKKKTAQNQYKQFVAEGIKKDSPWKKLEGQILLGREGFLDNLKALITDKENVKEIPKKQRFAGRSSLSEIFRYRQVKEKSIRDSGIYEAHMRQGYTLKEIADYLDIHYTTVSKVVREMENCN